ncbi:hypothetical protein G7K_1613-t1 [Saitoella complicata NRRL Y-17804]|uniref:Uncharacterized protein n=1 Tax=Saitoella complicata (strain BCRC 22490 / CBS 7301 / JCM 7358 / NBRC 10748 / NRRL Y-17804) TaxID=698492 RepID=A0A0E9NDD6_SAICN|nr:hypothetical protein G7K_1613-t1 [Saitoella complicata NRRL Y-17804]
MPGSRRRPCDHGTNINQGSITAPSMTEMAHSRTPVSPESTTRRLPSFAFEGARFLTAACIQTFPSTPDYYCGHTSYVRPIPFSASKISPKPPISFFCSALSAVEHTFSMEGRVRRMSPIPNVKVYKDPAAHLRGGPCIIQQQSRLLTRSWDIYTELATTTTTTTRH